MKRIITATTLSMGITLAQATPLYHPPGTNLTYGAVSNGQSIMSEITNPAAGAAALKKNGDQYRFGVLSSIGIGVEFGDIDNLYDELDNLANLYDFDGLDIPGADIAAEVDTAIASANTSMRNIAADGYAKGFVSLHLPLMPLVAASEALGGSVVLDVNGSLAYKAYGLQSDINFDPSAPIALTGVTPVGDVTIDADTNTFTVNNDSSVITKAAQTVELALGYSRPVFNSGDATLYAGLRGRYYQVGLSQLVKRMEDLTDAKDLFNDAKDLDLTTESGYGIDVGTLWVSKHYRLGAWVTNINEPEFEFNSIDLSDFDPSGPVAQQILKDDTYTMEQQLSLEAALYTANQNWVISAGYDTNGVEDALGDEYQWATVSAAYATESTFIPGVRLGYRKNLVDSEISYITFGATLAHLNLDIAWSTEDVTIEDDTVPRGAMINLGLDITF